MTVPRVALVGASGHGAAHRRHLAELAGAGRVHLVGLCDVRPIEDPPPGVAVFADHAELLRAARPEVVVICTPPHTHLPIATDALRAGCDVLLEKPPVLSLAEHDALTAVLAETGRACQIGFQALGSAALAELVGAIAAGRLGRITGVSALACWQRDDGYYARSPWAGRRVLNGRPSLDGALANPLAHAVMQALAVADIAAPGGVLPGVVEVECYRTRPIEVDDTATLRVTPANGPAVLVAVTLAGEDFIAGEITVSGTAGSAVLEYPTDRLRLPGDPGPRTVPGRVSLLENLLDHGVARDRADPAIAVPLIAPLARTAPFTAVLDVVRAAGEPTLLGGDVVDTTGEPPARVHHIPGINAALRACADRLALLSEAGVPWAGKPYRELVR